MAINGESCILALLHRNTTFRSTSIKLYFTNIKVKLASKESSTKLVPLLVKRSKGRPRKNPNIIIFLQNNAQSNNA